ncbi:MAG: BspA family leucine-rich repeat surface protein [Bacteroidales bacterium]|nr:BspA family leucine-rich repeat surface protein [Bacteroidales bacterium]
MSLTNEAFKSKSVNVELYAEGLLSGSNIISTEGITADADGQATAYFAVPATGKEVKNCAIYATAGETTYKTILGNNTITSGNLYNIAKSSSNFEEIPAACYLPNGKTFRDAVVAAIGTLESVQVKFIANSRENLSGATEIGTGTGAYIKVNGSVIEIHTAAKEFVFNANCSYMFGASSLEEATADALARITAIDFNDCINTSNVTRMCWMFSECSSLTSLDLSNFNTEKVTDMSWMFYNCSRLTSLDLSNFNTANVTNMTWMFDECSSLTSLDVSKFNTENVTNMSYMFRGCSSLTSLDLSKFNTENVTNMSYMFDGCSSLTSLDLSKFNTENVTNMSYMFRGCSSLTSLDLSNFNTENVTDMHSMFNECEKLQTLDLSNINTANVTNMKSMFGFCSSLTSLDLSNFNTEKVADMSWMFYHCSSLTSLDLTSFNVSKVTDFGFMFYHLGSKASSKPISVKVTKAAYDILSTKSTGIDEDYAVYSYPTE